MIGWEIGIRGGRPYLERHGRWLHLDHAKLDRAEAWFERWGDWAVLLGRLTPVVRSFVSIPAGIFDVPFRRYTVLTLIGSAIWCFVFAGIGWAAGCELGELPPRLQLRRHRRRRRDRRRCGVGRLAVPRGGGLPTRLITSPPHGRRRGLGDGARSEALVGRYTWAS